MSKIPLKLDSLMAVIADASQVAYARRLAARFAVDLGFGEVNVGKLSIIITEAATNVLKHGKEGKIVFRALERNGVAGIEVLAIDRGPGIVNLPKSLQDGYSTAGSAGTGLGAITRLSNEFELSSIPGKGTILMSRVWELPERQSPPTTRSEMGAVALPIPSEADSGDGWAGRAAGDVLSVIIVDGLGHGIGASDAARAGLEAYAGAPFEAPAGILDNAHAAMRHTRGAAMAVARIDFNQQAIRYAGIGNISGGTFNTPQRHTFVSMPGIVGHEIRQIREFTYPWSREALLIMHSDGLASHWNLDVYPGLVTKHPSLIAGALYSDHARGNDDVTVVAMKQC